MGNKITHADDLHTIIDWLDTDAITHVPPDIVARIKRILDEIERIDMGRTTSYAAGDYEAELEKRCPEIAAKRAR